MLQLKNQKAQQKKIQSQKKRSATTMRADPAASIHLLSQPKTLSSMMGLVGGMSKELNKT
jgi:hypothetical protein